jgi:hypothetical protein
MPAGILLTTAYFPPPEYFVYASATENVLIERHENYIKQTYRNRCIIMAANGILPLVIPVKRLKGIKTPIRDIKPDYNYRWQRLHLITLESAYRSAPFYEYYIDEILPFFKTRYRYLLDLNSAIFDKMLDLMNIGLSWEYTGRFMKDAPHGYLDKRESFHPKKDNPELTAIREDIKYGQVFQDRWGFIPGLSILDLLFNAGPDAGALLKKAASEIRDTR